MTGWLLILTLALPGEPQMQIPVGLIFGEEICGATGRAVTAALRQERPETAVSYTCLPLRGGEPA